MGNEQQAAQILEALELMRSEMRDQKQRKDMVALMENVDTRLTGLEKSFYEFGFRLQKQEDWVVERKKIEKTVIVGLILAGIGWLSQFFTWVVDQLHGKR